MKGEPCARCRKLVPVHGHDAQGHWTCAECCDVCNARERMSFQGRFHAAKLPPTMPAVVIRRRRAA